MIKKYNSKPVKNIISLNVQVSLILSNDINLVNSLTKYS